MKSLYLLVRVSTLSVFVVLSFFFLPFFAMAQSERIKSFDVSVQIKETGEIVVAENILYDFGQNDRHGIFREIPKLKSTSQGDFQLVIKGFSAVDEVGNPYQFSEESSGGNYVYRIGDPNRTISGKHSYALSYEVGNAIDFYENFDELYWNATGNEWNVPIEKATVSIALPFFVERDELRYSCYQGGFGSSTPCENIIVEESSGKTVIVFSAENLGANEGLTGALSFPKNIVPEIERAEIVLGNDHEEGGGIEDLPPGLLRTIIFIFVGGVLVAILGAFSYWWKKGRDPKGRGVIVRQYDAPKGMSPVEVGFIVDNNIDNHDIIAEIVFLAEQGFLHILAIPKRVFFAKSTDYYLLKIREPDDSLKDYQKLVFAYLFSPYDKMSSIDVEKLQSDVEKNKEIKMDKGIISRRIEDAIAITSMHSLSTSFSAHDALGEIKAEINKEMTNKGYFSKNPASIRKTYGWVSAISIVILLLLMGILSAEIPLLAEYGLSVFFTIVVVFFITMLVWIFSRAMIQRTEKGVIAREHALGLKEYLSIAEKDRLEFHFNPKNNPELFEKLLPYAIALGVEKKWAKELGDMLISPDWYSDAGAQSMTLSVFYNSFSGFNSSMTSSNYSSGAGAGSFGGGFSGGGGGGGGGGSW